MRKIFQIASYDFRRLALNPITLIVLGVLLLASLILNGTYKIPTEPAFQATFKGESTQEVYNNFINSSDDNFDNKKSIDKIIEDAKNLIAVQMQETDEDFKTIQHINLSFNGGISSTGVTYNGIKAELDKYRFPLSSESSKYIIEQDISEIKDAAKDFETFLTNYQQKQAFESKLMLKNSTLQQLKTLSEYFSKTANLDASIETVLDDLVENIKNFDKLDNLVDEVSAPWSVSEKLQNINETHIQKAELKLANIENEMKTLANKAAFQQNPEYGMADMQSLITNYKHTCQSVQDYVKYTLYSLLNKNFKNGVKDLYNYQTHSNEDISIALAKLDFVLNEYNLYFTPYQVPLDFNRASYKTTVYDKTYFIISIVGFLTIIFGIFCAYKLFGRDRRNGKMDIILSQNVSYSQVFAGKFIAIIFSTMFVLFGFLLANFLLALILNPSLSNGILAVFNLKHAYNISPFLFLLIKVLAIEFQVIFYSVITVFIMNITRKFEVAFGIAMGLFVLATILNIFLNGTLVYCLLPFIHADLSSFIGGGRMHAGFLQTHLYTYGNFYISLVYYVVLLGLLYSFTNQLFKKN